MENTLKEGPALVATHPMLIHTGLHLSELEAGEGVKGEIEPIFPLHHKVTDEQTLCCTGQVEDADHLVHFGSTSRVDGALRVGVSMIGS